MRSFPVPPHFPRGRAGAGMGRGGCSPCSGIPFAFWSVFLLSRISGMGRSRASGLSAPLGLCYLDLTHFWLFHLSVCLTNELYQMEGAGSCCQIKVPAVCSTDPGLLVLPCRGSQRGLCRLSCPGPAVGFAVLSRRCCAGSCCQQHCQPRAGTGPARASSLSQLEPLLPGSPWASAIRSHPKITLGSISSEETQALGLQPAWSVRFCVK